MSTGIKEFNGEVPWRGGRTSDSKSRGPGFNPHTGHSEVSLSKTHLLPRALVNTQEVVAPSRHDLGC